MNNILDRTFMKEHALFDAAHAAITSDDGTLLYAGALLRYAARTYKDAIALIYNDQEISFAELYKRACIGAYFFKKRGVVAGDRVLICFENSSDFYIVYFAAWQAGAVVVPVNTFLKEQELYYVVQDAQPKIICTLPERVSLFAQSEVTIVTPEDIAVFGKHEMDEQALYASAPIERDADALCALLYTSGTTGVPKGVMLSSRAIITNVLQVTARLQRIAGVGERIFAALPLFHVFAQNTCVWVPMLTGCTVILIHKIDRRLILHGLQYKPTFFLGVPALYGMLCLLKNAPLDSVRYFVSGGDALPDKIRGMFALLYRRIICNGYGLTETAPVIAVDLEGYNAPTGMVGRPLAHVSCVVRDENGNDLARNTIGELWVSGSLLMMGYYHAPDLTNQVLINGYLRTGDLAYIDEHGAIVITGRIKDVIIQRGLNIYPQEVENVLLTHSNVIGAAVVGCPNEEAGEIPVAFIQLRTQQVHIEKELRALCLQRLANYKVPNLIICSMDPLPLTSTGKVDKKILRMRCSDNKIA